MSDNEDHSRLDKLLARYGAEEKSNAVRRELERLLGQVLDIADALHDLELHCADLERKGVQGIPRKSVNVVLRMLMAVLKSHQVEPMNCKGQTFDLNRHEVLGTRTIRRGSDDVVLEETMHGYMWQQRVLRHAKVIVSRVEAEPGAVGKRANRRARGRSRSAVNREIPS
jgi:molecular chaperone GrpE